MFRENRAWCVAMLTLLIGLGARNDARAEVQENVSIPVELVSAVPCENVVEGEVVTLTGDLHILTRYVINGNIVRGAIHFQPQGISGYGSITGDRYHASGLSQGQFKSSLHDGQAITLFENDLRIIGPGRGNNFLVHEKLHLTINANGDMAAVVDHVSVRCE